MAPNIVQWLSHILSACMDTSGHYPVTDKNYIENILSSQGLDAPLSVKLSRGSFISNIASNIVSNLQSFDRHISNQDLVQLYECMLRSGEYSLHRGHLALGYSNAFFVPDRNTRGPFLNLPFSQTSFVLDSKSPHPNDKHLMPNIDLIQARKTTGSPQMIISDTIQFHMKNKSIVEFTGFWDFSAACSFIRLFVSLAKSNWVD